jgi:ABC-2 type transport system permease protein
MAPKRLAEFLDQNGYLGEAFITSLTIAAITMMLIAVFLLPLYAALVGGDLVAKESEDGTLRMILSRPISRPRLLLVKWVAGLIFSVLLVLALGAFGLLFARLWFPWGSMFVWAPEQNIFSIFGQAEGAGRYAIAHLFLVGEAASIMCLAFMFSCFNVKPAAATVLALSAVITSFILQQIPYFRDYQHWIFTYHLNIWIFLFDERIPWWRVGQSLSLLFGFNLTFFVIGMVAFQIRDIKS